VRLETIRDFDGLLSCLFWFLQRRNQGRNNVQPRDHQVLFVCSQALIFTVWFGVLLKKKKKKKKKFKKLGGRPWPLLAPFFRHCLRVSVVTIYDSEIHIADSYCHCVRFSSPYSISDLSMMPPRHWLLCLSLSSSLSLSLSLNKQFHFSVAVGYYVPASLLLLKMLLPFDIKTYSQVFMGLKKC